MKDTINQIVQDTTQMAILSYVEKKVSTLTSSFIEIITTYSLRIIASFFILFIGWKLISLFCRVVKKQLPHTRIDPSYMPVVLSTISVILKVFLFLVVAGNLGIEMTSLIALLTAFGIAVGMALSGTLQNFAGSVIILITRPYRIKDFVEMQGYTGYVQEIHLFHTVLDTFDDNTVILANGSVANGNIINYTRVNKRRVKISVGIHYDADMDKAKAIALEVGNNSKYRKTDIPTQIFITSLEDSSITLEIRIWTSPDQYWIASYELIENIKKAFDKNGICIPYPQKDVHLYKHEGDSSSQPT